MSAKDVLIAELESELREVKGFLTRSKMLVEKAHRAQNRIAGMHQPYLDRNTTMSKGLEDGTVILRCRVCRTPEHHTYGPLNDVPWPCPTMQTFMDLTPFRPPVEEVADTTDAP